MKSAKGNRTDAVEAWLISKLFVAADLLKRSADMTLEGVIAARRLEMRRSNCKESGSTQPVN